MYFEESLRSSGPTTIGFSCSPARPYKDLSGFGFGRAPEFTVINFPLPDFNAQIDSPHLFY
jgi:hypothetical protein